jgi:hypothetical protein
MEQFSQSLGHAGTVLQAAVSKREQLDELRRKGEIASDLFVTLADAIREDLLSISLRNIDDIDVAVDTCQKVERTISVSASSLRPHLTSAEPLEAAVVDAEAEKIAAALRQIEE